MGRLLFLAALVGGGWYAHQRWVAESPAYRAYQRYAEARARQDWKALDALVDGAAADELEELKGNYATQHLEVYGQSYAAPAPSMADLAGPVAWIDYQRESEESGGDDFVSLVAVQTVCRIPPGVTSAMCKWPVSFRHEVELAEVGGEWRVQSFSEERITP
jgi:hypothetical protein